MRYWRVLDLSNLEDIKRETLAHVGGRVNLGACPFWVALAIAPLRAGVPSLFAAVDKIGAEISEIALLVLRSDCSSLHIDHVTGKQYGVKARLNIPILNTEGSRTAFFEMSPEQYALAQTNPTDGTRMWHSRELYTPVTEVEVTQPTVLRTSAPHTVFCTNNRFPRLTLTMSFTEDAVRWLDADY